MENLAAAYLSIEMVPLCDADPGGWPSSVTQPPGPAPACMFGYSVGCTERWPYVRRSLAPCLVPGTDSRKRCEFQAFTVILRATRKIATIAAYVRTAFQV
jgi:hypothetical protein